MTDSAPQETGTEADGGLSAIIDALGSIEPVEATEEKRDAPAEQAETTEAAEPEADEAEKPEEAEEEEAEEEDTKPEEQAAEPVYEVIVDGQKLQVTQSELLKGYSREADYTRKSQALAETKRQFESSVTQERQYYTARLEQFVADKYAELKQYEAIDLSKLDPVTRLELKDEYNTKKAALQQAETEAQQMRQAMTDEQRKAFVEYANSEVSNWKETIPERADPKRWETFKPKLESFLAGDGFTPEQMGMLVDRRVAGYVADAMRYRELQKSKPEALAKAKAAPTFQRPQGSKPQGSQKSEHIKSLRAQANKGDRNAMASLLAEL